MSAEIALVEGPEGLAGRLRAATELAVTELASAARLLELLRTGTARLAGVALGPAVAGPVEVAQRVGTSDSQLAVVVLAAPGAVHDVTRALQFAPFIGEDVSCRSVEFPDAAAGAVAAAAARTIRRREHRKTLRAAAGRLGAASPLISAVPSAQSLGTLLDQAPVGVVTVDPRGRVASLNRYAERLLEADAAALANCALTDAFPPEERDRLGVMLAPSTPLSPSPTRRFRRTRANGATQELDVTAARFESALGQRGTILLLQEVTARAAAERERRLHALSLQEEIVRRLARARAAAGEGDHDRVARLVEEALERSQTLARQLLSPGAVTGDEPDWVVPGPAER